MQQEYKAFIMEKVQNCTDEALLDLIAKLLIESSY
jgi:hypothetical protein